MKDKKSSQEVGALKEGRLIYDKPIQFPEFEEPVFLSLEDTLGGFDFCRCDHDE